MASLSTYSEQKIRRVTPQDSSSAPLFEQNRRQISGLLGLRSESFSIPLVAIAAILITGVCGVAIPLVGKKCRFLHTDSNFFVAAKAFAAGVILATGFVHMLPDATLSLTDPCLPEFPWSNFPFSGFIAMMAALATLLADFIGTQYCERKQRQSVQADSLESISESSIVPVERRTGNGMVFGEEEGGAMHIVGMHAHAAHHRHSHSQEKGACEGHTSSHGHSHTCWIGGGDEEGGVRHVVVSQVNPLLFYDALCRILCIVWATFMALLVGRIRQYYLIVLRKNSKTRILLSPTKHALTVMLILLSAFF